MGCASSTGSVINKKSANSVKKAKFSDKEKTILRTTWSTLSKDLTCLGMKIFIHIFDQSPSSKILFSFDDFDEEFLSQDPQFQGHSKRYVNLSFL